MKHTASDLLGPLPEECLFIQEGNLGQGNRPRVRARCLLPSAGRPELGGYRAIQAAPDTLGIRRAI